MGKDEARSGVPDVAVHAIDAAMSVARELPMTVETFLDWESRQEVKYEFDGFHTVAMTGGSFEHGTIQVNLIAAIRGRLQGGPCRIIGSEVKIAVGGSIRY